MKNDVIERKEILENVLKWKDEDLVKVITGVRRSGKSTVLRMIESSLKASGVSNDCIAYIDFECREYLSLTTKEQVWEELDRQLTGSGKKYVLLDEVQRVRDFELLVDALYADKQYDCYLTGSNAWMLSGELATYLSGRYVAIHVTPLSFSEYVNGLDMHPLDAFVEYSNFGSFPFVRKMVEIGRQNDVGQYLEGIFNTVLLKDVALRAKMSDTETLQRISAYLFDNIGNLTNTKRISDQSINNHNSQKLHLSHIIVTHNAEVSISELCNNFDFDTLIITSDNYHRKAKRWIDECKALGIPYHYTAQDGAYIGKQ